LATSNYREQLQEFHNHLADVAQISAHLLDLVIDLDDVPEWQTAACSMMRKSLIELVQQMPFPERESV